MAKIVIIPNNEDNLNSLNHDILIGIEGYSVNVLTITFDAFKKFLKKNKNVFVALNKNFTNSELEALKEILIYLDSQDIKGIFYYDVAVVNIVKKLNLKINLIWSAEHLTTNYYTINYWYNQGVKGTFISNEITKKEMITISDNTESTLFVQLFGYIPMYVSRRHAIRNYLKYFNVNNESSHYQLFKEDKKYAIIDNAEGTMIYSNFILNGLTEKLELDDKIAYIIINGFNIDNDKLNKVINYFETVTKDNVDGLNHQLEKLFDNLGKGFLYEESIYKVKNDVK